MEAGSVQVPVKLANGAVIRVEATAPPRSPPRAEGEQDVAYTGKGFDPESDVAKIPADFDGVVDAIEGVAPSLSRVFERIKPKKAVVEFGLEVSAESGGLTALIVKGSGKANLKVTLE